MIEDTIGGAAMLAVAVFMNRRYASLSSGRDRSWDAAIAAGPSGWAVRNLRLLPLGALICLTGGTALLSYSLLKEPLAYIASGPFFIATLVLLTVWLIQVNRGVDHLVPVWRHPLSMGLPRLSRFWRAVFRANEFVPRAVAIVAVAAVVLFASQYGS